MGEEQTALDKLRPELVHVGCLLVGAIRDARHAVAVITSSGRGPDGNPAPDEGEASHARCDKPHSQNQNCVHSAL